jgi:uncharacterized protein (DUF362 family)
MEGETSVSKSALKPIPRFREKSPVCILRGKGYYEMVKEAFTLLDISQVINPGDTVLVKPNFSALWRLPLRGSLTSREALEGVIKALREHTKAGEIIIAEGSGGSQTWRCFFKFKVPELALKYGASLVDLNWDVSLKVKVPNGYVLKDLWVPRTVYEVADVIISLPVLKIWDPFEPSGSAISLTLKNMVGTAPGRFYGWSKSGLPHFKANDPNDLMFGQSIQEAGMIVDICTINRINIGIIDALTVMHFAEERRNTDILAQENYRIDEPRMLIAGFDPVAVDSVGSAVMGFNPKKIVHLDLASKKGLGTNNLEEIAFVGENLKDVKLACNPMPWHKEILDSSSRN